MYVAKIVNNSQGKTAANGGIVIDSGATVYVSLGSNSIWLQDPTTGAITDFQLTGTLGAGIEVGTTQGANIVVSIEIGTLTQGGYFNKIW